MIKKPLALGAILVLLANTFPLSLLNSVFAQTPQDPESTCSYWGSPVTENGVLKCRFQRNYEWIWASNITTYNISNLLLRTPETKNQEDIRSKFNTDTNSPNLSFLFSDYKIPIEQRPNWVIFKEEVIPDCAATNSDRASCHGYVEYTRNIIVENWPKEYLFNFRGDDLLQLFIDGNDITKFDWNDWGGWNNQYLIPVKLDTGNHTITFRQTNVANGWTFNGTSNVVFTDISWPYDQGTFYNGNSLKTADEIATAINALTTAEYQAKQLPNRYDISTNKASIATCKTENIIDPSGILPAEMRNKFKIDFPARMCVYDYDITPIGTISADITTPTTNNVVLTLTTNIDLPEVQWWTKTTANTYTKTVNTNTTYTANLVNGSKTGTASYEVTNIDHTPPTGSVDTEPTNYTNGSITLILNVYKPIQNPGNWWEVDPQNKLRYTKKFWANESGSFTVTDLAGHTSTTINYSVSKIDKLKPVVTSFDLSGDPKLVTSLTVNTITANDAPADASNASSGISSYKCSLNGNTAVSCTLPYTFTNLQQGNNTLRIIAIDNAGNESDPKDQSVTVDTLPPVCWTWTKSTETLTNQNVILTLNGSSDATSGLKPLANNTCTVENKGDTCSITIEDNIGHTTICTSPVVENIDKKVPTGTITADQTSTTTNDVILTLTVSEPLASTPTGWTQDPNNPLIYTRTVENNGEITVDFTDQVGNPGSTTFNVTNINRPNIIENPTTTPPSKYYAKVEFLPGTNGTLNGTTVFYVLKNKEINLTAPTVNPNFGYTFNGRNTQVATNFTTDVTYTAQYNQKSARVEYKFQSDDTTALLESLNAYKPDPENTTYGQTITPTSPKKTSEKTSEGTWKWKGWTETSKQVTEDVITFVGKWLFDPKPTGSITGQPTQWTKNTVTLTLTTNEDVRPPQGWTPINNSKREFTKDIEGNSTISVVVTDLGRNDSVQITATVDKIDKVNPTLVTLATKGKVSLIKEAQVEIHFAGEDKLGTNPINNNSGIAKYQCKLNNENWTTCNSPFTVKNLTEWTNTIKVKAIDNAGNQSDEKKVSIVSDRTAPVITLENWDLTLIHNVDTYKPANASCKDKIDDSCTVTKSWPDVPAEIEKLKGQAIKDKVKFTEIFTATDKAGNKSQIIRTINLIPADFPKITLIGLPTVTQELGTPYTDAGATAQDKQDGDITTNIVINNPVQDKLWTYTITYNVSDKSHNKAPEVTRTVTVVDTTKPTITPVSNQGFDEGKTITPIQITVTDHNPVVNIKVEGLPSGLSFDPTTKQITGKSSIIWIHTITITATDGSNNSQTSQFTLEIRDITPPVLESLKENFIRLRRGKPAEIVLTGTDNYKLGKIEIIGTLPAGMTISKTDFDGQKLAYLKITGTPTNIGTYHLTWTIVDKAGNKWNQIPFTIRVRATDPWSLNGGGGSSSSTDYCPNGDHSGNLYDGKCDKTIITITTGDNNPVEKKPVLTGDLEKKPEPEKDSKPELIDGKTLYPDTVIFNPTIINGKCYTRRPYVGIKDSATIITDEEFKKAMSFLRSYEMTMFDSVDDYDPYRNLSREEAAKIFSNFAINVLCRKPDLNLKVNYSDVEDANPTLKPYITLAYQLGVMKGSGMGDGLFRPFDKITKAEVNAVLIRMILKSYLDESQSESKTWYDEYNKVATNLGIINQGAGAQPVSRNNVALMLFRAYKNQAFDWRNIDYFSYVLNSRDLFVK